MRRLLILCAALLLPTLGFSGRQVSGSLNCPASGSIALSSSSVPVTMLTIQAPTANTGVVHIGGSNVTTSNGVAVPAGQTATYLPVSNSSFYNLNSVYIACTVNTDSITYNYQ